MNGERQLGEEVQGKCREILGVGYIVERGTSRKTWDKVVRGILQC